MVRWFIFKVFDQDQDGYLSYREMHELLTIGHPQLYQLRNSDIAPIKKWAKSESRAQDKRKEATANS